MNHSIKAEDVYDMLDPDQLQIFRDTIDQQLIKAVESGLSPRRPSHFMRSNASGSTLSNAGRGVNIDFGNYPLKPWINKKDNPNQTTMKVADVKKQHFFLPPKSKEELFVVKTGDTTPAQFELTPQIKKSKLLERSWIDMS